MPNTKHEVYEIELSLGFKTFRIKFKEFDEPVDILFNPADPDIGKRLMEAGQEIQNTLKTMTPIKINEHGMPALEEYNENSETEINEIIKEHNITNQKIFDTIDYAFGNKISDKIFKYLSPLAITDGQMYIMQFIDKILPQIQKIIESENKQALKNANKYLDKYKKVYHK